MQGDRIGRIFAKWAIDHLGQFFENYKNSPHFYPTFSLGIDCVLSLTKIGLGNILSNVFTNSSGHPGRMGPLVAGLIWRGDLLANVRKS
jgi:hypothetical protein